MKKNVLSKFALFAAILMFTSAQLFAQNMQVIGTGTIETAYPPNNQVFEYGWSTMLYTSAEMGDAKSITKIAFDQTTDYSGYWDYAVLENQKIYIKQAAIGNFGTLAYEDPDDPNSGYTLVFDGTIQFNLGWTEIVLPSTFEYDGTSSLIVHWENHRGTTAPIVNVKFNASTVSGDVFKAVGADGSFPTSFGTYITDRPNIAIFFNGTGPATPVNPTPANNTFKALVDTEVEFLIGNNTTSYDVYFGNTNPPTELILTDVPVSSPGSYSCNPSVLLGGLLDSYSPYYWQVVAKDGGATAPSEIWNFTTQGVIEDFPYATSFEDQPIRGIYADTVDWSWPLSGAANWRMMDYNMHTGDWAVGCNVWGEYIDNYSLVTPRIYLPENQRVSFWWMMNGGDYSELNMYFEITTNGGQTWELLQEFLPETTMTEYEQSIINLNGYEGNNVYFRWRYETLNTWVPDYFFLDDLSIEVAPTGAVIQMENPYVEFPPLAIGGETYMPLEVTNIGTLDLVITGSTMTAPYSFDLPDPIAPGESAIINVVMTASTVGDFNQNFAFTGDFEGDGTVDITGSAYQFVYNFFENADLSNELPENWSVIRTLDPYDIYTDVTIVTTAYDAYSAPNAFRMMKMNDTVSPLLFVTEGVGGYESNKLIFYAKKSYDDYDAEIEVGLTRDPLHPEAFTATQSFVMTTTYQKFEAEFPANSTEPYIAFKFVGGQYASAVWLDDISWDNNGNYPPYCPIPTYPQANATDVDVMMGLTLNWTSGGGNPTGYKLFLGTDPDATNMLNGEDMGYALSYSFLETPDYGTNYFWKILAYNDYGESTGCSTGTFTTMENPLVTVPYFENFDGIDAFGNRDCPLGWSIENENNDNIPWDVVSDIATPDLAHSTPNAMHVIFSLQEMSDYLYTPPVLLQAGVEYEMGFWFKTVGDNWVPYPVERMKVLMGEDNNHEAMRTEIYSNEYIDNQEWNAAWVPFTVNTAGEYFFGFYAFSEPNQGILLLDDVRIDLFTSVNENNTNQVRVFPNPTEGMVYISAKNDIQQISLYDVSGQLVYTQHIMDKTVGIETTNFNKGIYIVCIETNGELVREKLIVR